MARVKLKFGRVFKSWVAVLKRPRVRKVLLLVSASLIGVLLLVQLFYPRDRALLGTSLAAQEVSGWTSNDIK